MAQSGKVAQRSNNLVKRKHWRYVWKCSEGSGGGDSICHNGHGIMGDLSGRKVVLRGVDGVQERLAWKTHYGSRPSGQAHNRGRERPGACDFRLLHSGKIADHKVN